MRFYVNVDHVATIREARRTDEPDPVRAAMLVELAGADGITVHLREDRRHVSERDVRVLMETVRTGLNLELAAATDVLDIACDLRPMQATLVPERREEVTTEGGLALGEPRVRVVTGEAVERLSSAGIRTSLFVDPEEETLEISGGSRRHGRRTSHWGVRQRRKPRGEGHSIGSAPIRDPNRYRPGSGCSRGPRSHL